MFIPVEEALKKGKGRVSIHGWVYRERKQKDMIFLVIRDSTNIIQTVVKQDKVSKKDKIILIVNSIFYSLTIFAYAAFDRVEVGLIYSLVMMVVTLGFFIKIRKKMWNYPFITYSTIAYTLGGLFSLIVRLIRT